MIESRKLDVLPTCILLQKSERRWSNHLREKLRLSYKVIDLEAFPIIRQQGYGGLARHVNEVIESESVEIIFFSIDYFYGIDQEFVVQISPSVLKVLVTFDDISLHRFNSITAKACDLVLTADPVSVLKYKEQGISAEFFPLESSRKIFKDLELPKTIDVLFYGNTRLADRQLYLDYLRKSGIQVVILGETTKFVDQNILVKTICESRIVINFSKTGVLRGDPAQQSTNAYLRQLKGRIIESGLCGTLCLSEYSPAIELLYKDFEVPIFNSQEDCFSLVTQLLENESLRKEIEERFSKNTLSQYEDAPIMQKVMLALNRVALKSQIRVDAVQELPLWYRQLKLRVRVQHMNNSIYWLFIEIYRQVIGNTNCPIIVRLILFVDIIGWILYRRLLEGFLMTRRCFNQVTSFLSW